MQQCVFQVCWKEGHWVLLLCSWKPAWCWKVCQISLSRCPLPTSGIIHWRLIPWRLNTLTSSPLTSSTLTFSHLTSITLLSGTLKLNTLTGTTTIWPHLICSFSPSLIIMLQVRMRMEPEMPVSELDKSNVTLYCDLEQGNPPTLHAVRWYVQSKIQKTNKQTNT